MKVFAFMFSLIINCICGVQFSQTVLCIGEVLHDYIALPECNGWATKEVLEKNKFRKYAGGAPANVALQLAKFGLSVAFAGAVGDDEDGACLIDLFQQYGINTNFCQKIDSVTRRVLVTRDVKGDRLFSGFWDGKCTNEFADCFFQPEPSTIATMIDSTAFAIVVGTLGLAHGPTSKTMNDIIEQCKRRKCKQGSTNDSERLPLLVVDMNWRDVFWTGIPQILDPREVIRSSLAGADIVKLTDMEALWAFGISPENALGDPKSVFDMVGARKGVMVTAGEKGASYYFPGIGSGYRDVYPVKVVETTGAGDCFTAGFLSALFMRSKGRSSTSFSSEDIDIAFRVGCAAGALVCTREGAIAGQPTLAETLSLAGVDNSLFTGCT